jgi:hypothetical protein
VKLNRSEEAASWGALLFLLLPQTRLANLDEYLTNSHIFNIADLSAISHSGAQQTRLFNTRLLAPN